VYCVISPTNKKSPSVNSVLNSTFVCGEFNKSEYSPVVAISAKSSSCTLVAFII